MRKSLYWLIVILVAAATWDVLEREINLITQIPITFTIALLLCSFAIFGFVWWLSKTLYSGRIETIETDKKSLEERLKAKDEELEKQRSEHEKEIKMLQASKAEQLTTEQFKVLEFIDAFERNNPAQPNQFPPECSVDEVASKLQLDCGQVNEVFRHLRRAGFIHSIWEGRAIYLDMSRPINEERPARITPEGKAYLEPYRRGS